MPRTLKSKWARSYAHKRNKQHRGIQKLFDAQSHNSHKNTNYQANEIIYVKFNCKQKFGGNWYIGYQGQRRNIPYNPASIDYYSQDYDWKKQTIEEYLTRKTQEDPYCPANKSRNWKVYNDALKQVDRRGNIQRFVTHGRRFKQLDQQF